MDSINSIKHCHVCQKVEGTKEGALTAGALKTCAKCRVVYYCSVECQRSDWKMHRPLCAQVTNETMTIQSGGVTSTAKIRVAPEGLTSEYSREKAAKKMAKPGRPFVEPAKPRLTKQETQESIFKYAQEKNYHKLLDLLHSPLLDVDFYISAITGFLNDWPHPCLYIELSKKCHEKGLYKQSWAYKIIGLYLTQTDATCVSDSSCKAAAGALACGCPQVAPSQAQKTEWYAFLEQEVEALMSRLHLCPSPLWVAPHGMQGFMGIKATVTKTEAECVAARETSLNECLKDFKP